MRVAVLGGGRSSEHEVSLAGARAVREGLAQAGHEPVEVVLERDGRWTCDGDEVALRAGGGLLGCDAAFPVLHGAFGEDGTVQGLLELLDVPYVGSGVLASAACLDKLVFKDLMARAGIPQVAYWRAQDAGAASLPCWVKPSRMGSSVGIVRVECAEDLDAALAAAREHDPRVIVEAHATGLEVECSVLGHPTAPEVSTPGEIVLLRGAGWYDFEAKYEAGGMRLEVPARISDTALARLRDLAVQAYALAGCDGLARADFFVDGDEVLLNELNTLPGFTATSVYAKLWAASGLAYPELCDRLVRLALERFARERAHTY
ncbi:D-alanine--D-alanine ligase family protein [Conexibacter sp. SYSU D00693]|uniref:D-alanine--D-alanine ligase family protein n=1 Tax=Conexibacter sp. SYSU D00693 TaxID=2812560 RepID=UPI00196B4F2F|nr:D-alanine--D-alanine ligase family protein [Conexibacter sp. SYSU D00693]